jgi:hypothetical protein
LPLQLDQDPEFLWEGKPGLLFMPGALPLEERRGI